MSSRIVGRVTLPPTLPVPGDSYGLEEIAMFHSAKRPEARSRSIES